jgi:hypothetical protein
MAKTGPAAGQETIYGGPTKRFFVSMLTRDIELTDAILDLIDNSVDGATRQLKGKVKKSDAYRGYETRLTIKASSFDISDNRQTRVSLPGSL